MHHSRLCAFVIDCQGDDFESATRFWAGALGRTLTPPEADSPTYASLQAADAEPMLLLQQVDHEGRVHLDIETDNLDAEVARLEALGAKRIKFFKRWWLMKAPTGQVFCVVNPQRGPLAGQPNVNVWP